MAIQTDALATVYARSLYELAEDAGGTEKVFEIGGELEQICEMARADRSFHEFLASPIIETEKRGAALGRMFRDQITDLCLRFLLVVNAKGRLAHLESINAAFDQLVQSAHGRVEVDVYTAGSLGSVQLELIKGRINEALNKEPVIHAYTDSTMIGGVKLRIGDQLIDGSVATRLRRMKQSMLTQGGATIRAKANEILGEGA